MTLESGTRLGPYEVLAPLGAGGMGEVYRARDCKLGREVALKVLPEAYTQDADRMARFEREAQVLAALNHPHIATLYGLEDASGVRALAMELVEGRTLAERIAAGPLPLAEALELARQIAEALDFAHERGVIHRDLKPDNVRVTGDGAVKVLDFGLAKALDDAPAASSIRNSPTMSLAATHAGVILGTACYMAPEQASGQAVDRRSDVWSFGAVLWEMLCGAKLFEGETVSHTLADVLRAEIDWKRLPAATPPAVRALLRRCLERDRRKRLQAIGEARIALEDLLAGASPEIAAPAPPGRRSARLPWAVASLAAAAALALAWVHFRGDRPPPPRPVRFQVRLPEGVVPRPVAPALSPDGSRLVFLADSPGASDARLWVHRLDSLDPQPLPGTEGASRPFWSPDGRFIAFFSGGKLKKMGSGGGPVQVVCDAPASPSGAWGAENVILLASRQTGLARVSASGGTPEPLRFDARGAVLSLLPGGRHFLYSDSEVASRGRVFVASLDQTAPPAAPLLLDVSFAAYAAPGYLLYARGETLVAHRFDARALALDGDPITITQTAAFSQFRQTTPVASASANGVLAYVSVSAGVANLVWFDRSGREIGPLASASVYAHPALSPDGASVVAETGSRDGKTLDLYRIDVARKTSVRLTSTAESHFPVWAPDGKSIAFTSIRDGPGNLYRRPAGVGDDELLLSGPTAKVVCDWSTDGRFLLYYEFAERTGRDLWVLPLEGERRAWPYVKTDFDEYGGQFSPDARWIAYTSNETGQVEIYVQSFAGAPGGAAEKVRISSHGGAQPRWRRDGRELFYLAPDMTLMAADIEPGPRLRSGIPRPLFRRPQPGIGFTNWGTDYAVSADGRRFLVNVADAASRATPITVVLNWTAALKP